MKKLNRLTLPIILAAVVGLGAIGTAYAQNDNYRYGRHYDRYEQQGARGGMGYGRHAGRHGGWGCPMADGMGYMGGGPMGYYNDYTVSLITPAEVESYRTKLRGVQTLEECKKVEAEHRKLIEERAAAMNTTAPTPRYEVCTEMQRDGWFSR